ncbi:hypothetical protein [uncultured Thiohalocapsa sp.]|uniref:hypothetical protein n=1 Tax=uncultured Thiohalocapsa sp. TaxID=768990 RepID=UPI0025D302D4|nr:hypothetical protein [uncultured Thiohalocapsa sp.]
MSTQSRLRTAKPSTGAGRCLRPAITVAILLATLLALGCSGAGEDVRVTLCKDIVAVRTGAEPVFEPADVRTRGYQGAEVRLAYQVGESPGRATCFYAHDAVEDTADQLANPLNAYATSPERVVITGETLSRPALAEAVKQAMLKQGRHLVEQAGDMARKAVTQ